MEMAQKVCKELLSQRSWTIDAFDQTSISGKTCDSESFVVYFLDEPKLNIANVKDCIKTLEEGDIKHCIIVYKNNITSSAKRVIGNFIDTSFELFTVTELQFNITKHYLVPLHIKLSESNASDFIKKMGVDIPVLLKTDPVCRFYNFPRGAIIQVTRKDNSISYRIVK
jgi:DNA-directed RNA polymerase I, II, and III subunit RPABC1